MVGRIFKKNNSCFCYKTLWISHVRLLVEPGYRKESWISKEGDTARTNFSSPGRVNGSTVFYIASKMPKKREDSPLPPSIPSFLPSFPSFTFKTEDITNWKKREYPPSYRPPPTCPPPPPTLDSWRPIFLECWISSWWGQAVCENSIFSLEPEMHAQMLLW